MKMYSINLLIRKLLVLAGSFLFIISGYSQGARNSVSSGDSIIISPDSIPELSFFINQALNNSPLLNSTQEDLKKIREEIKMEKTSWLSYFFIDANARYGLFNQLTINEQVSGDPDNVATLSNKQQLNYYGGLTIKIPLNTFSTRGSRLRILKSEYTQAELKKEALRQEISSIIIEEYFKMKYSQETFLSYQEMVQTENITYLQAKRDLENGVINMNEYSLIVTSKVRAEEMYLKMKNDFYSQFYKILIISGIKKYQ